MLHAALDIGDAPAGVALIPRAIELLGRSPELHDEVAGQVLRLGFAPFLAPKLDQGCLVTAHDDPGVRAANERTALEKSLNLRCGKHFAAPDSRIY